MKDINELLSQFDDVQDLPVSEEMLGAYIEGNLDGSELRSVQNLLNDDDDLFQMINSFDDTDNGFESLISSPQTGIEIPTNLDAGGGINPFEDETLDTLNDNSFALSNGDSIFDIDFGQYDLIDHHDSSLDHGLGHDHATHIGSNEIGSFGHNHEDIF